MSQYTFKLPDVGEGTAEATIANWLVKPGDRIEEDQPLVAVETDKAIVEIPAPAAGTVLSVHGEPGEKIAVGAELVVIETEARQEVVTQATTVEAGTERPAKTEAAKALASPAVRKRARELGVDLAAVQSSGPGGRVTHADLDAFLGAARRQARERAQGAAAAKRDIVDELRIVGVRRRIAERMQEAKRRIPHFSYVEEVDVTALEELRAELNDKHAGRRAKLTPLAFLMRAIVRAVAEHPEINARFDDEKGVLQRHAAVHIGIATQTPNGLVVPVVTDAQARDLWECAAEAERLAAVAREGHATRAELTGSTITLTSLGALGGVASTPIINSPEVAIVGTNRIAERPVVRNGAVTVRKMMNLSSSFDHRVVDGWNAASFIQAIKRLLEQPATLFVD
jgi:2-oxoisovalerate dehydrogenase E2 component (dihydrolipoyl transacylase)